MGKKLAFAYPEPDKSGRGKKGKVPESGSFGRERLRQARQVLRYSRSDGSGDALPGTGERRPREKDKPARN
jgi:hypothetical protein